MYPNCCAGMRSSLDSSSRTPPPRTEGSSGKRPAVSTHWMTSMHPPHVAPVTDRAGPAHAHGSVGSRSPYSVSASGSAQSLPKSSDSPGSVTSSRSPVSSAARSAATWQASTPGPGPSWTWVEPP